MEVEAVFFDAGNTVIYADPPVGEVYARALRGAGVEADAAEVAERFRQSFRRLARARGSAGAEAEDARDWWRRVVRECFEPYGPLDSFEQVFEGLWDYFARGEAWKVYGDVLPTFEALRARGKTLGLISNWDVRLDAILEELGLAGRLDSVVVSHQVGVEKPDAAIFRRALELGGLAPEEAVHVGDSYEEDVVGARAAGMRAVWLRRDGPTDCTGRAAAPVIGGLEELLDLIG